MDTTNDFFVGVLGDGIAILNPPRGKITKEQALRLAAYLVLLADDTGAEFPKVLEAVKNA